MNEMLKIIFYENNQIPHEKLQGKNIDIYEFWDGKGKKYLNKKQMQNTAAFVDE